jgi:hypothetical protein
MDYAWDDATLREWSEEVKIKAEPEDIDMEEVDLARVKIEPVESCCVKQEDIDQRRNVQSLLQTSKASKKKTVMLEREVFRLQGEVQVLRHQKRVSQSKATHLQRELDEEGQRRQELEAEVQRLLDGFEQEGKRKDRQHRREVENMKRRLAFEKLRGEKIISAAAMEIEIRTKQEDDEDQKNMALLRSEVAAAVTLLEMISKCKICQSHCGHCQSMANASAVSLQCLMKQLSYKH